MVAYVLAVCDRPVDSVSGEHLQYKWKAFLWRVLSTSPGEADTCQRCRLSEPSLERTEGRSPTALRRMRMGSAGFCLAPNLITYGISICQPAKVKCTAA